MRRPTGPAQIAHMISVTLMGVAVIIATVDGFAQSWAGLYGWGVEAGLADWKAMSFPGLVDLFILVGELGVLLLALEGHKLRKSWLSWTDLALPATIAAVGWSASLAFNIGHVHGWKPQVTAAVPPIASMLGLLVLLRTVHRIVTRDVDPVDPVNVVAQADLAEVDQPPAQEIDDNPADNTGDPEAAAQKLLTDIAAAVKAATDAGVTPHAAHRATGLSRHRIGLILKPLPETPAAEPVSTLNGHDLNGDQP